MKRQYLVIWLGLVVIRLGWSVVPQTGYIHPDEFFQTVEVVAGDVFNISVVRTWEFNEDFPLRSIVLPKMIFAPAFHMLKVAAEYFPRVELSPYMVIACSRFVMASLSLIIDYCVYKTSHILNIDKGKSLCLLAGSYVMMTYQTHSFTNSIESLLMVIVSFIVLRSKMGWASALKSQNQSDTSSKNGVEHTAGDLQSTGDVTEDTREGSQTRDKMWKTDHKDSNPISDIDLFTLMRQLDASDSITQECKEGVPIFDSVVLTVTNVAGMFNRPTFVLFSLIPVIAWIECIDKKKLLKPCIVVCVIVALLTAAVFLVIDTMYYNNLSIADIVREPEKAFNSTKLTILHFIVYNTQVTNLELHGRHPFYLHFIVNLPLLFGPMMFYVVLITYKAVFVDVFYEMLKAINKWRKSNSNGECHKPSEIETLLLGMILFPTLFLSAFPHQEPRFLVPLLPVVVICVVYKSGRLGTLWVSLFIIFNVSLAVVYGSLHQGGIIPCLMKLNQLTADRSVGASHQPVTVIFSHTYMPPKHLLLSHELDLNLIDLAGDGDWINFNRLMYTNIGKLKPPVRPDKFNFTGPTYFVCPGSVKTDFLSVYSDVFDIVLVDEFFPHLSMEDPPVVSLNGGMTVLMDQMSLCLYHIQLKSDIPY